MTNPEIAKRLTDTANAFGLEDKAMPLKRLVLALVGELSAMDRDRDGTAPECTPAVAGSDPHDYRSVAGSALCMESPIVYGHLFFRFAGAHGRRECSLPAGSILSIFSSSSDAETETILIYSCGSGFGEAVSTESAAVLTRRLNNLLKHGD